jgi:hypothetical protein
LQQCGNTKIVFVYPSLSQDLLCKLPVARLCPIFGQILIGRLAKPWELTRCNGFNWEGAPSTKLYPKYRPQICFDFSCIQKHTVVKIFELQQGIIRASQKETVEENTVSPAIKRGKQFMR